MARVGCGMWLHYKCGYGSFRIFRTAPISRPPKFALARGSHPNQQDFFYIPSNIISYHVFRREALLYISMDHPSALHDW